jgi:glycerol-3-phosphate dehydrogenase (NAD(P)+)
MKQLSIIGAGSWGTALALALAPRFETLKLWARTPELACQMASSRQNSKYLPGFTLPDHVLPTADLSEALAGASIVLTAVPSVHLRRLYLAMLPFVSEEMLFVSATKGLENGTLLRMSELIGDVLVSRFAPKVAVLSGPTFAREIAAGEPAAVVIAAIDVNLASEIQVRFSGPALRFYASADVIGVEIGAALKNVIAIGAGLCHGLGLGGNTLAALVTRGLAELTRLAVALGGKPRTLAGLAGLGDLVLTATGDLSRNRHVGLELASGKPLKSILSSMSQVAEGVETCRAAHELALRSAVEMPIADAMYDILYRQRPAAQAIRDLMERPLTCE